MNSTGAVARISLKNILFATDFSPSADAALPYAIGLAKEYGAKVHAVHVRFPPTYPVVGPEGFPYVVEAGREIAQFDAGRLHELLASVPHEVSVCEGKVCPWIDDIAAKQKADMIVIGTSGRTGVSRFFLGSVAEEIFRKAACPVLAVGPGVSQSANTRLQMKGILYATDFTEASLAALPYAISLAEEHQARLTLLHVVENAKVGELVHAEQYGDSIRRRLQKLVPPEATSWCEPMYVAEHGLAAQKIIEVATALGSDLIVLGVRGAQGGTGALTHLLRPVSHEVVVRARCPVLTVRA